MAYKSGFAAAAQALATSANYGPSKHPIDVLPPLFWKHGDTHIVRFLSDEAVPFPLHEFIPCVDGKSRTFACTASLEGDLRRPCYICANVKVEAYGKKGEFVPARPKPRVLLIAVEQEKDRATKRFSDVTREIDLQLDPEDPASATKVEAPAFGLITAKSDFIDPLNVMYSNFDTTVDRPYGITRGGDKNRPVYTPVPLDSDEFKTPESHWEKYGLDTSDGDPILSRIARWIYAHGSVEFYNRAIPRAGRPHLRTSRSMMTSRNPRKSRRQRSPRAPTPISRPRRRRLPPTSPRRRAWKT